MTVGDDSGWWQWVMTVGDDSGWWRGGVRQWVVAPVGGWQWWQWAQWVTVGHSWWPWFATWWISVLFRKLLQQKKLDRERLIPSLNDLYMSLLCWNIQELVSRPKTARNTTTLDAADVFFNVDSNSKNLKNKSSCKICPNFSIRCQNRHLTPKYKGHG
jgi:hypothetical protein